ncbi:MAG: PKD domain-containing protein [Planctomycetes bacterium]|nr:PKD domain-containing protein [Planctomycetota bacterium]
MFNKFARYVRLAVPNIAAKIDISKSILFRILKSGLLASFVIFHGACDVDKNSDPKLNASFTFIPTAPAAGQAVQFTDTSSGGPTSWQWDFGNGSTSISQNPSHTFALVGSYDVTLTVTHNSSSKNTIRTINVVSPSTIIVDHSCAKLTNIPSDKIALAKQTLHIAYGHTSHGSQLTEGMTGLVQWKGVLYAWNNGGTSEALDLRDYYENFGGLGIASDLGSPDRTAWATATRAYLAQNQLINVIIWSWCGQVSGTEAEINQYLSLMNQLEIDFPSVKFVYMTGHTDGSGLTGNVHVRNNQIRAYCIANNKILYDFEDIESYDPDSAYYGDKIVNDACDYDSNGDSIRDKNWAMDWQNAHPGEWYNCGSAHSQPLNANQKAYAAWWLWARLAGWDGR